MQAFIKDGKLIVNSQILPNEKEKLLEFIEKAETFLVSATTLYDIKGDKAGIEFNIKDDVIIEEVSLDPSEETQTLEGLFDKITISAIHTQEKTENLNFSGVDSIEFDSDENGYIKKITIVKDENLVPENIKLGITINGIEGNLEPDKPDQNKTVDPSEEVQEVRADTGYELASVTINAIPSDYVKPEGTMNINENGEYNVTNYAGVNVNVGSFEINNAAYLFFDGARLDSMSELLDRCKNITSMVNMFYHCNKLTDINLSNVTYNLNRMTSAFASCSNLINIDLGNINTENVISLSSLFGQCANLSSIVGLNKINTINATNTRSIFYGCGNIEQLDVSHFNLEKSVETAQMFAYCSKLRDIDVGSWNIPLVTDMNGMFTSDGKLSDNALNSILRMCTTATSLSQSKKTLSYIGLTQAQTNTCKNLSNYQDFVNAGWTTGY